MSISFIYGDPEAEKFALEVVELFKINGVVPNVSTVIQPGFPIGETAKEDENTIHIEIGRQVPT